MLFRMMSGTSTEKNLALVGDLEVVMFNLPPTTANIVGDGHPISYLCISGYGEPVLYMAANFIFIQLYFSEMCSAKHRLFRCKLYPLILVYP